MRDTRNLYYVKLLSNGHVAFYRATQARDEPQHLWDDSDRAGNISVAQAYLSAIGAIAEQVEKDGVSGWYRIDTSILPDDMDAHVRDSLRSGECKYK